MRGNLAETARAALTAACAPGGDAFPAEPARLDGATTVVVADVCVRGDLGFVLLLHRRTDGCAAEELYFSSRDGARVWDAPDHLSGSVLRMEPTSPRSVAAVLGGRVLVPSVDSETLLFTGRPQGDEGYEPLRFHTVLADQAVVCLDIEDATPGTPEPGPVRKRLMSRVALLALLPGERFVVRAVVRDGAGYRPWGEPFDVTGTDPVPDAD